MNLIHILSPSPDPYLSAAIELDAAPLKRLVEDVRRESGRRVSLTHVANKLLAAAIAENPAFNQVVLDDRIYEMETVDITNPLLLPGDNHVLTAIIIDEPHRRSLPDIFDEFERLKNEAVEHYGATNFPPTDRRVKFLIRSRLYKLIPERVRFRVMYQRGLSTNVVLTNAAYRGEAKFLITKNATHIMRAITRVFLHGTVTRPVKIEGQWHEREVLPLAVTFDHRLIDGYHLNKFALSLERLVADAGNLKSSNPPPPAMGRTASRLS
ncbi:MAG: 2-oxo acid dehydrogenase subunit E2 [Candidatus Lernaella stagnicola]|nr:2-oxo acid dehydrogenase subunit E2 [Candidatus Lernaella stagnicola]